MKPLLLILLAATLMGQAALPQDARDSASIRSLLAQQRNIQKQMDAIAIAFARRARCATTEATLNQAGMLVCTREKP